MCDIRPGQLILSFRSADSAGKELVNQIRRGEIEHVKYIESMETKLEKLGLFLRSPWEISLHLVEVPPGQETWKITYLQFYYKHALLNTYKYELLKFLNSSPTDPVFKDILSRTDFHFIAAPNHALSVVATGSGMAPVSGQGFRFGPQYSVYKQMAGLPLQIGKGVRVMVVDTGIASDAPVIINSKKNLLDPQNPSVDDDHGHGTAVTLVINDLAPNTEFIIFKAGDANGNVYEWDLLAALVADTGAHVINLSVEYGLGTRICNACGRQSFSSRSAVFENIVSELSKWSARPIVVAAAGNSRASELAYPARFGSVLAIGAINSRKNLSKESNYGDADHVGNSHNNHFVSPGGDSDPQNPEDMILLSNGSSWCGTSFAAAFATGVVASTIIQQGVFNYQYTSLLSTLLQNADKGFPHHNNPEYGHGIVRA